MSPSLNTLIKQSTLQIKTLDKYVNTLESNLNQYYYPGIIIIYYQF